MGGLKWAWVLAKIVDTPTTGGSKGEVVARKSMGCGLEPVKWETVCHFAGF